MKRVILLRLQGLPDRTLGALYVFNGVSRLGQFTTLEPPWLFNERGKSCIPPGAYVLSPRAPTDKVPYDHLIVGGTAPREAILMHRGNFPKNTEGCILPGMGFGAADSDGKPDVLQSTAAMNLLVQMIDGSVPFDIVDLTGRTA